MPLFLSSLLYHYLLRLLFISVMQHLYKSHSHNIIRTHTYNIYTSSHWKSLSFLSLLSFPQLPSICSSLHASPSPFSSFAFALSPIDYRLDLNLKLIYPQTVFFMCLVIVFRSPPHPRLDVLGVNKLNPLESHTLYLSASAAVVVF